MNAEVQANSREVYRDLLKSGNLPRSKCSPSFLRSLKSLFETGIVRWEKAAAGQRLIVINDLAYKNWFLRHFPEAQVPEGIQSSRIRSVAQFRRSKVLRSNLSVLICSRSIRDGVLLKDGSPVETTRATNEHGVFSFILNDPTAYALAGNCLLIENLAVFQLFERLEIGVPFAIWTGGISSNRFLNWLSANVKNQLRVLHLPDYDPVGLAEFLRYYQKLSDAVSLYMPEHLEPLFRDHTDLSILTKKKNQRTLMRLRSAPHPIVRRIVGLIEKYNGGLEHEALFVIPKVV